MPELPEVETVKRGLESLIIGLTIKAVDYDWQKSFPNDKSSVSQFMIGSKVTAIVRRGKSIVVELGSGYSLFIHLKMTGQLVFVNQKNSERFAAGHPNDSLINSLPDKTTRVAVEFTDGSKLFFNDLRKFGWMRLLPTELVEETDFIRKLGPEPLDDTFSLKIFKQQISRRKNSKIKAVLLDQSVLAGVGNIYADESLWMSEIHPETIVSEIPSEKIEKLYFSIREVLNKSIALGGSTDKNYVDAEGRKGSYLKFANVFRREGQSCPRCGRTIDKIRSAGRGTHVCVNCQEPPAPRRLKK